MKSQKKKNLRSTLDNDASKLRKEVDEFRKQLSDFKQEEADKIRKLRQKYETEIDEIDLLIEKSGKDKGNNQKSSKKNWKEIQEILVENWKLWKRMFLL